MLYSTHMSNFTQILLKQDYPLVASQNTFSKLRWTKQSLQFFLAIALNPTKSRMYFKMLKQLHISQKKNRQNISFFHSWPLLSLCCVCLGRAIISSLQQDSALFFSSGSGGGNCFAFLDRLLILFHNFYGLTASAPSGEFWRWGRQVRMTEFDSTVQTIPKYDLIHGNPLVCYAKAQALPSACRL